jgi:hypothetical protein
MSGRLRITGMPLDVEPALRAEGPLHNGDAAGIDSHYRQLQLPFAVSLEIVHATGVAAQQHL